MHCNKAYKARHNQHIMIYEYTKASGPVDSAQERSRIQKNIPARMNSSKQHRISFRRKLARTNIVLALLLLARISILIPLVVDARSADTSRPPSSSPALGRLKGHPFNADWGDYEETTINNSRDENDLRGKKISSRKGSSFYGFGREISLFDTGPRGGARKNGNNIDYTFDGYSDDSEDGLGMYDDNEDDDDSFFTRMERYRERRKTISSMSSNGYNNNNEGVAPLPRSYMPWANPQRRKQRQLPQLPKPEIVQKVQDWWMDNIDPTLQSLPKMVCRVEPTMTLKLRKTFRPLKTIIRLGADYNTQQGIWQFKSSWEDSIIGGKITLAGSKELQLTKSWQMSVGGVEDLVTRLRFRATINLQTFQAYARVGFRTERLTPIDVVEGFTVLKRLPLDGSGGNLKLEVKANVALPEPEIEYSTEAQRSVIGMGNIEVSIDEMNLLLDY